MSKTPRPLVTADITIPGQRLHRQIGPSTLKLSVTDLKQPMLRVHVHRAGTRETASAKADAPYDAQIVVPVQAVLVALDRLGLGLGLEVSDAQWELDELRADNIALTEQLADIQRVLIEGPATGWKSRLELFNEARQAHAEAQS